MKIFFLSHSNLLIEIENIRIVVDPFFIRNPAFTGNINLLQKCINLVKSPNFILLTHAHYDHINDVELISDKNFTTIVANYEISNFFNLKNFKVLPVNFGSFFDLNFCMLRLVWAAHSSSFCDGTYGGNPGGYIINNNNKSIYISGDTNITMEMKLIPKFTKLNLAILSIGGYFTMDINDAILASDFLKCNKVLGIHYDSFPIIHIDHDYSLLRFNKKKKKLLLLKIGEYINI